MGQSDTSSDLSLVFVLKVVKCETIRLYDFDDDKDLCCNFENEVMIVDMLGCQL